MNWPATGSRKEHVPRGSQNEPKVQGENEPSNVEAPARGGGGGEAPADVCGEKSPAVGLLKYNCFSLLFTLIMVQS